MAPYSINSIVWNEISSIDVFSFPEPFSTLGATGGYFLGVVGEE